MPYLVQNPQTLGTVTTAVNMNAPTLATDGYALNGARYVNVWCQNPGTAGTQGQLYLYLYRTDIGWVLYPDVPRQIPIYAQTGICVEFEPRGAERVYARVSSFDTGASLVMTLEALTR